MRERYGIDAPGVVAALAAGAAVVTALAVLGAIFGGRAWGPAVAAVIAVVLGLYAASGWVQMGWYLYGTLWGKRRTWRRLLDELALRGDEQVLEVGPGRGAVLVEAARRLRGGRAVGIDLWRRGDQSGNGRDALLANARAADVTSRLEVIDGDMRDLPFPDRSFDVALASMAIHNLPGAGQQRALAEMVRVLRPGGRLVILDFRGTPGWAVRLRAMGVRDVRVSGRMWRVAATTRVLTGTR